MRKIGILLLAFLLLTISSIIIVKAQTSPIPAGIPSGELNPETGLPRSFDKFKETADKLSEEEQRKEYLKQEWTKILAKNKILGPFLFYTNEFFAFFNPFWKSIFGIPFSWSWAFIFSLGIWILLIILIYHPVKAFIDFNSILALVVSIIISSIIGLTGTITKAVDILTTVLSNIWLVWVAIIITVIIIIIYSRLMKQWEKESEKEKTERAEKAIQAMGEIAEKELESYDEENH